MFIVTFPFLHQSDACNILLFMSNVYLELHLFFKRELRFYVFFRLE